MKTRFKVEAHIPHGSSDAEWRIMMGKIVVAVIDPHMDMDEPGIVADRIAEAMNVNPEAIL